MKHYALIILILALVASIGGFLLFRDAVPPTLELKPDSGPVSAARPLSLNLTDDDSGLKNVLISVTQEDRTIELPGTDFERGTATKTLSLSLAEAKLKDGPLTLQVKATDQAVFANTTEQSFILDFDSRPPVVCLLTPAHNHKQSGAGRVL